jgi:alpha-tubulin suppressor-like RCC1 family protein
VRLLFRAVQTVYATRVRASGHALAAAAALCALGCGAEAAPTKRRSAIDDAVAVASSGRHACVLRRGGGIACWGDNLYGQLGLAGEHDASSPGWSEFDLQEFLGLTPDELEIHADAEPATGARQSQGIFVGVYHTCSITASGQVQCWGDDAGAQLGTGDFSLDACVGRPCNRRASTLAGLRGVSELALGEMHSCALREDGSVSCWGTGAVGRGERLATCTYGPCATTPIDASLDAEVVQVVSGQGAVPGPGHSCALLEDGGVRCWGSNRLGQVGIADARPPDDYVEALAGVPEPSPVALPRAAVELFAGHAHSCARLDDGTLYCWGGDQRGQLGTSATPPCPLYEDASFACATTPQRVMIPSPVTRVWLSRIGTCARTVDDELWCWGIGEYGQLGDDPTLLRECGYFRCSNTAVRVQSDARVESLVYDLVKICTLSESGSIACWGHSSFDEDGTPRPLIPDLNCTSASPCIIEPTWRGTARELFSVLDSICLRTDRGEIFCVRLLGQAPLRATPLMVVE